MTRSKPDAIVHRLNVCRAARAQGRGPTTSKYLELVKELHRKTAPVQDWTNWEWLIDTDAVIDVMRGEPHLHAEMYRLAVIELLQGMRAYVYTTEIYRHYRTSDLTGTMTLTKRHEVLDDLYQDVSGDLHPDMSHQDWLTDTNTVLDVVAAYACPRCAQKARICLAHAYPFYGIYLASALAFHI
jgi:hypothetical protein